MSVNSCIRKTHLTNSNLQNQRGFTLVEILVALTLGLLVTATILQIFLSSKQVYLVQEQSSRMQENGSYALELLSKYIRMAGYIDNNKENIRSENGFNFFGSTETIKGICGQADEKFAEGQIIAGFDGDVTSKGDCIIIRYHGSDDGFMADCFGSNTFTSTKTDETGKETKEEHPVNGSQTIVNAIFVEEDTANGPLALSCRSMVLNNMEESIESTPRQAFASGIENIQIRYGVVNNPDLRLPPASGVQNYLDAKDVNWNTVTVISVQIALLVSSDPNINITDQHQSYVFPPWSQTTTLANDFRLRRIFTTTINLRNQSQNFHVAP